MGQITHYCEAFSLVRVLLPPDPCRGRDWTRPALSVHDRVARAVPGPGRQVAHGRVPRWSPGRSGLGPEDQAAALIRVVLTAPCHTFGGERRDGPGCAGYRGIHERHFSRSGLVAGVRREVVSTPTSAPALPTAGPDALPTAGPSADGRRQSARSRLVSGHRRAVVSTPDRRGSKEASLQEGVVLAPRRVRSWNRGVRDDRHYGRGGHQQSRHG